MSKNNKIFDDLTSLESAQYIGLLKHISWDGTIFGKYHPGEWKPRELGLTLRKLNTAINKLAEAGLITIVVGSDVVAYLTDLGKKHLEKETKEK